MVDEDASDFVQTLVSRRFIITVATIGIMFPLSLYRDIPKLAKTSTFAIFALFFIWFVMLVVESSESGERRGIVSWYFANSDFLPVIGVSSSVTTPSRSMGQDRWAKIAHLSVALLLFLSMGRTLSGYFVFGSMIQANILYNFNDNNGLVAAARVIFAMNMFTTFPL
jgi:sodium-coupled neutral amino acid transporter 11